MEFKIESVVVNQIPVLRLMGEIDVHTAPVVNRQLESIVSDGATSLVVNMDGVDYIDSIGLGTIAHAAHAVLAANGKIVVTTTRPHIHKLFNVSGLLRKNVVLADSETSALQLL